MDEEDPIVIPITDVFDLHSVPARDARMVVDEYLEQAHALGLKALRIIHGRGIGVQREMVRKVLASKDYVVGYSDAPSSGFGRGVGVPDHVILRCKHLPHHFPLHSDAPAEAGGWGATLVTLR